jgi:glutamine amidotransferase
MMQNGGIKDFLKIKRRLINRLDEEIFQWIQGQTDTQYIFALFMTYVKEMKNEESHLTLEQISSCLSQTFAEIETMKKEVGLTSASLYNLVLTNGKELIATRYSTQPDEETRSLHIAINVECYTSDKGILKTKASNSKDRAVIISSEALTSEKGIWNEVPENHFIMVDEDINVTIRPLQ